MIQSNMYLDDNLVGGFITKTELKDKHQPEEEVSEKIEEEVKQVHMKVLFERNIAIFYFNLLRKVWNAQNQKLVHLDESLFYRLLFALTRMGMLFLQKLCDYLGNQIDKISSIKETDTLSTYKNTIQFK
jgi:hypothetical protein